MEMMFSYLRLHSIIYIEYIWLYLDQIYMFGVIPLDSLRKALSYGYNSTTNFYSTFKFTFFIHSDTESHMKHMLVYTQDQIYGFS